MATLELSGFFRRGARVVSNELITSDEFKRLEKELGKPAVLARKVTVIAACRVQKAKTIETVWNGETTVNTAHEGDWEVTNLDASGAPLRDAAGNENHYVIAADKFAALYERAVGERDGKPLFRSKGTVSALYLANGLDIIAPWGERQSIAKGYLLLNGAEVYGNDVESFRATYRIEAVKPDGS